MNHASGTSGARIADYWLHEELPARSTEIAYRATHRMLPRRARVAILSSAFVGVRLAEVQLMREACVLETLHHPGVPRVFECGVLDRRPWVAGEHITGTSIEEAAAERPLPISDALAVVRDAAAILAHAHRRGVVHRDLTPRSIVRTSERGFPVCITDWGDASIDDSAPPRPDAPGTRCYRAPELAGDRAASPADVFALGAVMFEAATLALPEPVQKFPGVPAAFHELLASMLAQDPADRPTAAAVHAEAARLAELYGDADAAIEEVEVELVDISRTQTPRELDWIPPDRMASASGMARGTPPHRKES
ncbi:MAG TPA: protein kinase [Kofleriaceae bacterium]